MTTTTIWTESHCAAQAVAIQEHIPLAERKEMLAELGLLSEDGEHILDDVKGVTKGSPRADRTMTDLKRVAKTKPTAWDKSSVPQGLRDYDPKAAEQRAHRNPPESDSDCTRRKHVYHNEPLCEKCRLEYNEYQRDKSRRRRERVKAQKAAEAAEKQVA